VTLTQSITACPVDFGGEHRPLAAHYAADENLPQVHTQPVIASCRSLDGRSAADLGDLAVYKNFVGIVVGIIRLYRINFIVESGRCGCSSSPARHQSRFC